MHIGSVLDRFLLEDHPRWHYDLLFRLTFEVYDLKFIFQGDGASTPEDSGEVLEPGNKDMKGPFSVQLEVDVMQWMLFVVALATRMWKLEYPRSAVYVDDVTCFDNNYCYSIMDLSLSPPPISKGFRLCPPSSNLRVVQSLSPPPISEWFSLCPPPSNLRVGQAKWFPPDGKWKLGGGGRARG